jgi:hypothetical protein
MPTVLPRFGSATAAWTGREVLVWSSTAATSLRNGREVVLAYNAETNRWRTLPASGLAFRSRAVVVWTGNELVVWGGLGPESATAFDDGARLDPATGTWRRLPAAPVPGRAEAAAAWSGHEVLIWGGDSGGGNEIGQGVAYNPGTNTWRALPFSPLRAKSRAAGVWTGRHFFVMGGTARGELPAPGPGSAAYDPATGAWTAIRAAPRFPPYPSSATDVSFASDQRDNGLAVWTGTSILFVGGGDHLVDGTRRDGVRWTPEG